MLDELEREHIRRAYHIENRSIRQLSREEGLNRITSNLRFAEWNQIFEDETMTTAFIDL